MNSTVIATLGSLVNVVSTLVIAILTWVLISKPGQKIQRDDNVLRGTQNLSEDRAREIQRLNGRIDELAEQEEKCRRENRVLRRNIIELYEHISKITGAPMINPDFETDPGGSSD